MKDLISFLVGFMFGLGYALLGVKSPAPPIMALFGLFGMVIGEQGVPWMRYQYHRFAVVDAPVSRSADIDVK